MTTTRAAAAALALCCLWHARAGHAQPSDLSEAPFNIDVVTGPVLGSHVDIGMGGARTALAVGSDGAAFNPASFASRGLWQLDWFEWDVSFDFIPGSLRNTDFDNNGQVGFTYDDFVFVTLGGALKFGAFGLGAIARVQTYNVGPTTAVNLILVNYGLGYAFWDGALVVGLGARTAVLEIVRSDVMAEPLVSFTGTGPELGVLFRPHDQPFRIGIAGRTPVFSRPLDESVTAAGLALPAHVKLPWELQVGAAVQLGPRPLNRVWENPDDLEDRMRAAIDRDRDERWHRQLRLESQTTGPGAADGPQDGSWWQRERQLRAQEERALAAAVAADAAARQAAYDALPRGHWLFAADLVLIGPSDNAIGTEAFLSQMRTPAGEHVSIGVRAGVETEPIDNRLKVRLGGYLEPSRFADVGYRAHLTTGGEVRLFRWDVFGLFDPFDTRVGLTFDFANRYLNWIFGVGFWH